MSIPVGYLTSTIFIVWCAWWAVSPIRPRGIARTLNLYSGMVVGEIPLLGLIWIALSTWLAFHGGNVDSVAAWVIVGFNIAAALALIATIVRSLEAIPALRRALATGPEPAVPASRIRFRPAALLGPLFRRRRDVERIADLPYGPAGERNLIDLYLHRSHPAGMPVFIHLHAGALRRGKKNSEALPLIYRMAADGWLCISANYRLLQDAEFPAQLIDVKKIIAWVRANAAGYGADPSTIVIAGGSAGGQLAAHAALTPNDRHYQPEFEHVDTAISAAIPLYAYLAWVDDTLHYDRIAPPDRIPPFFFVHGDRDSLCPVEQTRAVVAELRGRSRQPVLSAELPGAEHNFDYFHSIRSEATIDAIALFATWVRTSATLPESQFATMQGGVRFSQ